MLRFELAAPEGVSIAWTDLPGETVQIAPLYVMFFELTCVSLNRGGGVYGNE